MEVIIFEKEAFYKLLNEVIDVVKSKLNHDRKDSDWISEIEAKKILGIKSKTKMQQLRDTIEIEFSQFGKTIRYSRSSTLNFLERHRIKRL